jgi:hypothetical protein
MSDGIEKARNRLWVKGNEELRGPILITKKEIDG